MTRVTLLPLDVPTGRALLDGGVPLPAAPGWPHEATLDGLRMAVEGRALAWLILRDGVVIGECGTHAAGPDTEDGDVEIGYGLAEGERGRGAGTAAVAALVEALLADPSVRRVTAHVVPGNEASIRVLEKNGFVDDGRDLAGLRFARTRDAASVPTG